VAVAIVRLALGDRLARLRWQADKLLRDGRDLFRDAEISGSFELRWEQLSHQVGEFARQFGLVLDEPLRQLSKPCLVLS
jgi:hypothetical protein